MGPEPDLYNGLAPRLPSLCTMSFRALGVVFGDIGTSPLYTMVGIFPDPSLYNTQDTIGAISTIIWSITLIPLIEYVFIVMFAGDDNGEGGTFVLYTLLSKYAGLSPKKSMDPAITEFISGHNNVEDKELTRTSTIPDPSTTSSRAIRVARRLFLFRKAPANSERRGKLLRSSPTLQWILLIISFFGASLTMSDGLLTPAISIISAVNGLTVVSENATQAVVPVSCVIVVLLFAAQQFGTNKISGFFAPIIFVWMMLILVTGIINVTRYPGILLAFNPVEAVRWFVRTKDFRTLGGVLLALTGVEAMFADLGHFNRPAIQIAFVFVVYPAIIFAYLGQGARLILDPLTVGTNPFYNSIPGGPSKPLWWIVWTFGILATVIASQALISALFSLVYQATSLDCLPKLKTYHTSTRFYGQVYLPVVNWVAMVIVILICIAFGTSAGLSNAFGFAVATVLMVTTLLLSFVIHLIWGFPLIFAIAFFLLFGFLDGLFWVATLSKVAHGAWFPLILGIALTVFMSFWKYWTDKCITVEKRGRVQFSGFLTSAHDKNLEGDRHAPYAEAIFGLDNPVDKAAASVSSEKTSDGQQQDPPSLQNALVHLRRRLVPELMTQHGVHIQRYSGITFFYTSAIGGVPLTFQRFVSRFPALADVVVFVHVRVEDVSHVSEEERISCDALPSLHGFYYAVIRFGYMDPISLKGDFVKAFLLRLRERERDQDLQREMDVAISKISEPTNAGLCLRSSAVTHVLQRLDVCHDERAHSMPLLRNAAVDLYSFISSNVSDYSSYQLLTDDLVIIGIRTPI